MTREELDAVIVKLIVAQYKPRSTGNSHHRKRWENQRYWRLCTVGESCKIGVIKSCRENYWSPCCEKCYGRRGLTSYGKGRVYTRNCKSRYRKFSTSNFDCKTLKVVKRVECRTPRRFKGDISNGSEYKRLPMKHAH